MPLATGSNLVKDYNSKLLYTLVICRKQHSKEVILRIIKSADQIVLKLINTLPTNGLLKTMLGKHKGVPRFYTSRFVILPPSSLSSHFDF